MPALLELLEACPLQGQTALLFGLTFTSGSAVQPHVVSAANGHVIFEHCTFRGGHPFKVQQGLRCSNAHTVLSRCTFFTGEDCIQVAGEALPPDELQAPDSSANAIGGDSPEGILCWRLEDHSGGEERDAQERWASRDGEAVVVNRAGGDRRAQRIQRGAKVTTRHPQKEEIVDTRVG
jgi:hypothetical protein